MPRAVPTRLWRVLADFALHDLAGRDGGGSEAVERHPPHYGDERHGEREEAETERDDLDDGRVAHD